MPEFKSNNKAAPNPFSAIERKELSRPDNFPFDVNIWRNIVFLTRTSLDKIALEKSYFTMTKLVNDTMKLLRKTYNQENKDEIPQHPEMEDFVLKILEQEDLFKIKDSNFYSVKKTIVAESLVLKLMDEKVDDHVLPEALVREKIDELKTLSDEQKNAVLVSTLMDLRVNIIEGAPGAGKSHTMRAIVNAYNELGYEVLGTAIAYTAAQNLARSAGIEGKQEPLSSYILKLEETVGDQNIDYFKRPTVIILDEAGMVDSLSMAKLLYYTRRNKYPVKIIVTGDSLQLNPVQAGNILELMVNKSNNTVRINQIRRQKQESHRYFIENLAHRVSGPAIEALSQQESIHFCSNRDDMINRVVEDYLTYIYNNPNSSALILTIENKDVQSINLEIRKAYKNLGWISGEEVWIKSTDKTSPAVPTPFAIGDQVVIRENDKDAVIYYRTEDISDDVSQWKVDETRSGLFNRYSGVVSKILKRNGNIELVVDLYGDDPGTWNGRVILNTLTFKTKMSKHFGFPVVHNHSMTIYASQGQTVDQTFFLNSTKINSRLALVGNSRHRSGLDIYANKEELASFLDKKRNKSRPMKSIIADKDKMYKNDFVANITTDRYLNSDYLKALADIWSKEDPNQTVHMLIEELKFGKQESNRKFLLDLKWDAKSKDPLRLNDPIPVTDFCPARLEPRTPIIDVKTLFDRAETLEDLGEGITKVVRNNKNDSGEIELKDFLSTKEKNIFGKREHKDLDIEPVEDIIETQEHIKLHSLTPSQKASENKEIPFIDKKIIGLGEIKDDVIVFNNPYSAVRDIPLDSNLIKSLKGDFWDVGRFSEPRILARDGDGTIVSRYRLDGTKVVGDGYPPIWFSRHGDERSNILIFLGVKELMLTLENFSLKFKDEPHKIPHMIWAAKDADWGFISDFLRTHEGNIILLRAKNSERQEKWSIKMKEILNREYNIDCSISPKIEQENKPKMMKP